MNRKQKRELMKKAMSRGVNKEAAEYFMKLINQRDRPGVSIDLHIKDGDEVIVNVDRIMSNKNYERMNKKYRDFIESSRDVKYTAKIEKDFLICLEENPLWYFVPDDILLCEEE